MELKMSKWHRVELDFDQFQEMDEHESTNLDGSPVCEGRVKCCGYLTHKSSNGITWTESLDAWTESCRDSRRQPFDTDQITYVFKFKDEIEATAFKLTWS